MRGNGPCASVSCDRVQHDFIVNRIDKVVSHIFVSVMADCDHVILSIEYSVSVGLKTFHMDESETFQLPVLKTFNDSSQITTSSPLNALVNSHNIDINDFITLGSMSVISIASRSREVGLLVFWGGGRLY